jgi:hypothetical protein
VLDLKVCDPAMGSGAFLVEACRALGERLVAAWARWPETRPKIPADEDEELHARRLVAQRCLYGVDKNPRAVDLARLSLWLATLARDHEFTFLDHALKCGDSLVGLTTVQIAAANWDESKLGLPLFRQLIKDRVTEAEKARAEIQSAPDDTMRAIQEARHKQVEIRLSPVRLMGDAVVSAFFAADKARERETARAEVESHISGMPPRWDLLEAASNQLRSGEQEVPPFHWIVEFPEVFSRENGGFDAIVGNPPFLGGTSISERFGMSYFQWLRDSFPPARHHCDLVAYFFRRSFYLLRIGGAFGLISTNTISQGDTREGGLAKILLDGGKITHAVRRLRWPGEAAVIVSVVHIVRGIENDPEAYLDGETVTRISAYLVEGKQDLSPLPLVSDFYFSLGSKIYGQGFVFDDGDPKASPHSERERIISKNPDCANWIFPYLGGEEINKSPTQTGHRYVINVSDIEYENDLEAIPEIYSLLKEKVWPERMKLGPNPNNIPLKRKWWTYQAHRPILYRRLQSIDRAICISRVTPHLSFSLCHSAQIFSEAVCVITSDSIAVFTALQSRIHEIWARFFSSSLKDDLRYTPSDCFRTFPLPVAVENSAPLITAGNAYFNYRAQLMIDRDEGLTKTYNRFHTRGENAPDIARLRMLHADMDAAVLRTYGWDSFAERAVPAFIEQDADEGKSPKTRLDWPPEFKDEVLARLLALNAERAAAERAAGLTVAPEEDEAECDEDGEAA